MVCVWWQDTNISYIIAYEWKGIYSTTPVNSSWVWWFWVNDPSIQYLIASQSAEPMCNVHLRLFFRLKLHFGKKFSFQENIWKTQFERIAQFEGKLIPELWMQIRYCSIQRNIMNILSFTILQTKIFFFKVLVIMDIDCFWNQGFFRICNWILSP